jgi:hypothetical protein
MANWSRFQLTARPKLTRNGKANGQIDYVEFSATSSEGNTARVWRIDEWYLTALFNIFESPELVTDIISELRAGNSVTLPGDYSGTQLIQLGFRMPFRKPPHPFSISTINRSRYAQESKDTVLTDEGIASRFDAELS